MDILEEISRDIGDIEERFISLGTPIFKAFGCIIFEKFDGNKYIYSAANKNNYGVLRLMSRKIFIAPNDTRVLKAMLEKLRTSRIAEYSLFTVDRKSGKQITLSQCKDIMSSIFKEILPQYGYTIREEQISLAEEMLEAISRRQVMLAEAEVGTGKTMAYLFATILAKRGRLNDYWNKGFYHNTQYAHMAHMPIVIATSSIALQKAIVNDYIPKLSNILLSQGMISTPITAVIRKGREHYLCEYKLREHMKYEINADIRLLFEQMLERIDRYSNYNIDLSDVSEFGTHITLNSYKKRKLSVPKKCYHNCPYRENCSYLQFREQAQSRLIDIQVCNHQYLLADTQQRAKGIKPLIPNYQSFIIDEAHKFKEAAQSMYGLELSKNMVDEIKSGIAEIKFKLREDALLILKLAKKLYNENRRLFRELLANKNIVDDVDDEVDRFNAVISKNAIRHLCNMSAIAKSIIEIFSDTSVSQCSEILKHRLLRDLETLQLQSKRLSNHEDLIYWLEGVNFADTSSFTSMIKLCGLPKDLDKKLYQHLWNKGVPTILTSGTLSTNGDFSHIKNQFGINHVSKFRLTETSKTSPFDYPNNTLLYISEHMPFPNNEDYDYIVALANEIEELLYASHGHACILFTSYKAMDMVLEHLKERAIPFPIFQLDKNRPGEVENFKQSGNGVLFASGSMWEGIDIPGDILSMLIIVKLPFSVPDPVSQYEQSQYGDISEYKDKIIVPEMLIKLKQGFGRLIRSENDTGVVAILDSRANKRGFYHKKIINTLPVSNITDDMEAVEQFFKYKKSPEYFN